MYHLPSYITQGGLRTFLTSRKEGFPYDGILTDNAEILADMQLPDIPVKSFAELGYDFEVDGKIQLFLEAILFPLVIIDQLNVGDLFRIYEMVQSPITLVNLHTGLGGFTQKIHPDLDDISLFLETDAPVWEPFDVTSLQHILQTPIKQYVRVFDQEVIEHIFDPALLGGKNIIDHDKPLNGIIDCRIQGDDHPQWTILTSGGLLPSTIKVCDQFAGQGIGSDFFLRVNYQQTEHDALADHLKQTGKLAIILDHEMNDELQEYIDELCEYVGLDANHCVVIVPQIDKVTTHQRDYLYEQAGLGVGGIVEKLGDLNGLG